MIGMKQKKEAGCAHLWEFIEKWLDSDRNEYWEFYCKYCLDIYTVYEKRNMK